MNGPFASSGEAVTSLWVAEVEAECALMERALAAAERRRRLREQLRQHGLDPDAVLQLAAGEAPSIEDICFHVCLAYRVTVADLRGNARHYGVAHPRQAAYYLCWLHPIPHTGGRRSLSAIARWFGGRDHTTALHGIRAHMRRMDLGLASIGFRAVPGAVPIGGPYFPSAFGVDPDAL